MRGLNICFHGEIRKFSLNRLQYPLLSGAQEKGLKVPLPYLPKILSQKSSIRTWRFYLKFAVTKFHREWFYKYMYSNCGCRNSHVNIGSVK